MLSHLSRAVAAAFSVACVPARTSLPLGPLCCTTLFQVLPPFRVETHAYSELVR